MANPYVMSVLFVCGLLLVGVLLRATLRPLRAMFVPASVVGGLIGLALIQAGLRAGPGDAVRVGGDLIDLKELNDQFSHWTPEELESISRGPGVSGDIAQVLREAEAAQTTKRFSASQRWSAQISNVIDGWPGLLIAVVFAGLLIERPGKRFSEAVVRAGRQGIVVWIIVVGQVFLGLLATALLVAPFYDVPRPFGQLIETGFAGGHGTAAAMGQVFSQTFNFTVGRDLAFLFATFGLVWGTITGIVLINIGVRRGWVTPRGPQYSAGVAGDRPGGGSIGLSRIRSEIIDPLAFQLCLLAAAFAIGWGMQKLFLLLAGAVADERTMGFVGNIPLFLFTLIGGWTLREGMHLLRIGHLIDPPSINRLTGIAMEFLIVAALATLRIEAAAQYLWPVVLLLAVGAAWCVFCLVWLSPRLLPKEYWFELGLINYGMSTGTTAQGLMLLRIVDPDLETRAAEDYAAGAPLSAPFIGGGVLTVLGIPMALAWGGYWPVIVACAVVMIGLYVAGRMLAKADQEREQRGFEVLP